MCSASAEHEEELVLVGLGAAARPAPDRVLQRRLHAYCPASACRMPAVGSRLVCWRGRPTGAVRRFSGAASLATDRSLRRTATAGSSSERTYSFVEIAAIAGDGARAPLRAAVAGDHGVAIVPQAGVHGVYQLPPSCDRLRRVKYMGCRMASFRVRTRWSKEQACFCEWPRGSWHKTGMSR